MKFIETKEAPAAIGPYSQAIEANGFIYLPHPPRVPVFLL